MGYSLTIGEAELSWSPGRVSVTAEPVRRDDAPAFGEPTDYESQRWPSYSCWAEAMQQLGLTDIMFNHRNGGTGELEFNGETLYPLIQDHPGVAPITKSHADYVTQKLNEYRAANPEARPAYPPPKPGATPMIPGSTLYRDEDLCKGPEWDHYLCRGVWLEYWLRWAVENCKQPVFVNS